MKLSAQNTYVQVTLYFTFGIPSVNSLFDYFAFKFCQSHLFVNHKLRAQGERAYRNLKHLKNQVEIFWVLRNLNWDIIISAKFPL